VTPEGRNIDLLLYVIMSFIIYRGIDMKVTDLAGTIASLPVAHGRGTSCGVDVTGETEADIRALIDDVAARAASAGVTLKGVRAGGDVFAKLGGAQGYLNAFMQKGVPVVIVPEFGKIEFVFA
jgi:hypothetical protein